MVLEQLNIHMQKKIEPQSILHTIYKILTQNGAKIECEEISMR